MITPYTIARVPGNFRLSNRHVDWYEANSWQPKWRARITSDGTFEVWEYLYWEGRFSRPVPEDFRALALLLLYP